MTKIRVAIADYHPVVVAGLACELGRQPSLEVLGTARNAPGVVELLRRSPCDVLVTDHTIPGGPYGDGLLMLTSLRRMFPGLRILVLTAMEDMTSVLLTRQLAELGVATTLCKSRDVDDLVAAVHAAYEGLRQRPPTRATSVSPGSRITLLSQRETQVLRLYVSGMSVTAIAAKLHRTKQTVSAQKRNAMRKLGMECDAQLYRFAVENALVEGT
ncbi:LuxR family transcriptional regulator [Pandoraea captiosa]|jgi:two-component system capsular synthesis response regulator RcsB|uniref:LuxR family transcriptional regulator n=1 Tax=Pandoraea captiosa TaxID=2508302 RepID=A0A5E4ZY20_9BURK|nr:response regulator transcription factor [Pandoraea captiosa]VVE66301.1 LuxR family transcriptional regulator [Pandoraea captiosa]